MLCYVFRDQKESAATCVTKVISLDTMVHKNDATFEQYLQHNKQTRHQLHQIIYANRSLLLQLHAELLLNIRQLMPIQLPIPAIFFHSVFSWKTADWFLNFSRRLLHWAAEAPSESKKRGRSDTIPIVFDEPTSLIWILPTAQTNKQKPCTSWLQKYYPTIRQYSQKTPLNTEIDNRSDLSSPHARSHCSFTAPEACTFPAPQGISHLGRETLLSHFV